MPQLLPMPHVSVSVRLQIPIQAAFFDSSAAIFLLEEFVFISGKTSRSNNQLNLKSEFFYLSSVHLLNPLSIEFSGEPFQDRGRQWKRYLQELVAGQRECEFSLSCSQWLRLEKVRMPSASSLFGHLTLLKFEEGPGQGSN
jgi:hypothetical protein